jgi:hypothetical protein
MKQKENDYEYYFATCDEKSSFIIYKSEIFKLSEIDLINLIKICLVGERSKAIGRKILAVYRDSTTEREHITRERLKMIGIEEEQNPIKVSKKTKIK